MYKLPPEAKQLPPPPPVAGSTTVKTSNKLLAGYMAHEFRTKGTVLGRKLDGARGETVVVVESERYKEMTSLVMMNKESGAYIPGVVNPAQLARWIQM